MCNHMNMGKSIKKQESKKKKNLESVIHFGTLSNTFTERKLTPKSANSAKLKYYA